MARPRPVIASVRASVMLMTMMVTMDRPDIAMKTVLRRLRKRSN